jgi:peptide/nickel transport system substrate-binding protein
MKRVLALLAALGLLVVSGCSGSKPAQGPGQSSGPKRGGNLIVAATADTPSLDPHVEGANLRSVRTSLLYETLVWADENLQIKPQLAETWEVAPGGLEYTFHLRKGVKFHNGKEMDAEDVKYSYDRLRDEKTGSPGRGDFGVVKSIDVVDPYTVRFVLTKPNAAFLAAIGGRYSAVVPKDIVKNGNELKAAAVGTGPFRLKEWAPKEKLVYERFPDYWDKDKVYLDTITVQIIPDENSIVAALRSGQVGFTILGDTKKYLDLKDDANLKTQRQTAVKWAIMDLALDQKPTDNLKVRQAIALAIDKQAVVQAATQGIGTVIGVLPPAMKDFALPMDQLPNQKRDVARAKQLMAEAGYPNGTEMTLRIINGYPEMPPTASVIAANLKEIGMEVKVQSVDLGVWSQDWSQGKNPPTLNAWGGFMDPDLLFYRHFHKKPEGGDFRRWNSDQGSKLLDQGREALDPKERVKIYAEFQKLVAEEVPTVPLYAGDDVTVAQKYVEGYVHHPSGWFYGLKSVWLNK